LSEIGYDSHFTLQAVNNCRRAIIKGRKKFTAAVFYRLRAAHRAFCEVLLQVEHVIELIVAVMFVQGQHEAAVLGIEGVIRIGYTGGDGFEIKHFSEFVTTQKSLQLLDFDGGVNRHKLSPVE
jgi:hypothetical protein